MFGGTSDLVGYRLSNVYLSLPSLIDIIDLLSLDHQLLISTLKYVTGPVCSLMCDKAGIRVTALFGAGVATTGLVIASYSGSFPVLLSSAGVIFGK